MAKAVSVIGLKNLDQTLKNLEPKLRAKLKKRAIRKALEPVHQSAVQRAPVGETGNLANSIKQSVTRDGLYGQVATSKLAPHAHLVEFGHRIVTKDGKDTGKRAKATPFLRPAWDENNQRVLNTIVEEVETGLEKLESRK